MFCPRAPSKSATGLRSQVVLPERAAEAVADEFDQRIDVVELERRILRSERHPYPQLAVVRNKAPFPANTGDATEILVTEIRKDSQKHLVGQLVYGFL